ncbi:fimbrillin family protein [Phocaeicola sp.]
MKHTPFPGYPLRPIKAAFAVFSFCLCLSGCTNDENSPEQHRDDSPRTALSVSGSISTLTSPRATNTAWEDGDRIGIFMLESGKELTDAHIAEGAFNRSYTYINKGDVFSPSTATDTIWFPQDAEQKVDFIAYYPHSGTMDKAHPALHINLSEAQTDYLYASRLSGCDRSKPQVTFAFHRLLSRVEVELIAGKGMENVDLSGASVRISGIPTTATCTLADGSLAIDNSTVGTLALKANSETEPAYLSSLLLPSSDKGEKASRSLVITLPDADKPLSWTIPSDKVFRAGESTVYHITLKKKEVKPDPEPDPEPSIIVSVTSQITDWTPGNGNGESGSAD